MITPLATRGRVSFRPGREDCSGWSSQAVSYGLRPGRWTGSEPRLDAQDLIPTD
jgi:hypothetical protein